MKKVITYLALLIAGIGISDTAKAAPTLRISDGTTTYTITDNIFVPPADSSPAAGQVTWVGNIGVWILNIHVGTTYPILGTLGSPYLDLSFNATSSSGAQLNTLTISFSNDGFASTLPITETVLIGGTAAGNVSYQTYGGTDNILFSMAHQLSTQGPFSPVAFSGTGTTGSISNTGSYSITQVVTITHSAGVKQTTGDAAITGSTIPAAIGNFVWLDNNHDGKQDVGEPGVQGVVVELHRCQPDTVLRTTTTDVNGMYLFSDLVPGDYYVKVLAPPGYVFTIKNATGNADNDSDADTTTGVMACTTLSPGETDLSWDAGLVKVPTLALVCAGGTGVVGTFYSSALVASGGTPPYNYSITLGSLPPGLTLNPVTGAITGIPLSAGNFPYTAKVTDSTSGSAQTATSTCLITIAPPACVPSTFTFSGNSANTGTAGNIRSFTVNGISVKASAFSRTKPGGAWATAYLGAYSGGLGVTDTSEDGSGNSHTVDNIGRDNFVLFEFSQPVVVNRAFLGYVVTDSDLSAWVGSAANPYINHLTLSDSILAGLTQEDNLTDLATTRWADLNSGLLSGNVLIIAGLLGDTSPEDQFKIGALDICQPIIPVTLACVSSTTGTVGTAYSSALVATGGTPPYTFSIVGALPGGLTLNTSTGAITGTPTTPGTFAFTAKVVDSVGSTGFHTASQNCSITIAPAPVTLACVSSTTGTVGTAYSSALVATGGTPPYKFSIVGALPGGLTLNTTSGAITGTPTTPGTFAFTATVVDSIGAVSGHTASKNCSITIAGNPVTLACVSAGTGTAGTAYSSALVASGGTPPYTFTIIAGGLPGGLTLNSATGAITGTPTTPGTFAFTAMVVDFFGAVSGHTASANCSITIGSQPCVQNTFTFSGNTALYGTAGNIRTFTVNGISVRASAFSRTKSGSTWAAAYLGAYNGGLGVTDSSEGNGSDNSHTVDNIGRDNFVLFEFSQPVVVNRAFLGYVVDDSDLTAWVGNAANPYVNHLTLSNAILSGMVREDSLTDSSSTRWADLNSGNVSGNVLIVAGWLDDTTPDDEFKISALDVCAAPVAQLPSPWQSQDIGCVSAVGRATYASGTFSLMGSGNNLGGVDGQDEFQFTYQQATGDCAIVAQVLSVQNTNSAALAGVMIRENLGSDSRQAGAFVTPGTGIHFLSRASTGGSTADKSVASLTAPYWVKVVRSGNTFTAYRSPNGSTWTQIDVPVTINMGSSVYIGLAVNSHVDGTLCTATFNNVTPTP